MRNHVTLLANNRLFAFPALLDNTYNLIDESSDWGGRGQIQDSSIACDEKDREVSKQNRALDAFATDHENSGKNDFAGQIDAEIKCWPFNSSKLQLKNSDNYTNCIINKNTCSKSAKKSTGFHRRRKTWSSNHDRVIYRSLNALPGEISPLIPLIVGKSCRIGAKERFKPHAHSNHGIQKKITSRHEDILDTLCSSFDTCPDKSLVLQSNEYDEKRCTISHEPLFGSSVASCRSPSNNMCDNEIAPISSKYTPTKKANSCTKSADRNQLDSTFTEKYQTRDMASNSDEGSFVDRISLPLQDNITCDRLHISSQYPEDKSERILSWDRIFPAKFSAVAMNQSECKIQQYGAKIRELSPMTISPKSSCSIAL